MDRCPACGESYDDPTNVCRPPSEHRDYWYYCMVTGKQDRIPPCSAINAESGAACFVQGDHGPMHQAWAHYPGQLVVWPYEAP